ncbi:MAG: twin-arginine translocase TatA/TatE family subunit [Kiritimatiellae bacterium]|nr:twin-arginine translocase TatA/TatE family subunit [Kiritimatiellia bacterium]
MFSDWIVLSFLSGMPGGGELLVLFLVILVMFGPKRLPEVARSVGRVLDELRRASQDFKDQIMSIDEVDVDVDDDPNAHTWDDLNIPDETESRQSSFVSDCPQDAAMMNDDDGPSDEDGEKHVQECGDAPVQDDCDSSDIDKPDADVSDDSEASVPDDRIASVPDDAAEPTNGEGIESGHDGQRDT